MEETRPSTGKPGRPVGVIVAAVAAFAVLGGAIWAARAVKSAPSVPEGPTSMKERYRDVSRPSSDPVLDRELIPNAGKGGRIVNEAGFLGQSVPKERQPNTFRLLALGDANSMYYSAEGQNYLSLLKRAFASAGTAPAAEVLNFSVEGDSLRSKVRRFEVAGQEYKPDLIVVGFAPDDVFDLSATLAEVKGAPVSDPYGPEGLAAMKALFGHLGTSQEVKQAFFDNVFASKHWREGVLALIELARLAQASNAKVALVALPAMVSFEPYQLQPIHDAIRVQAERHKFAYLDIAPLFSKEYELAKFREEEDPFAYSPAAHHIVADALRSFLIREQLVPDALRATAATP